MKIFYNREGWNKAVNFVDQNNVFVGYDMAQCCCEDFGWFISRKEYDDLDAIPEDSNSEGILLDDITKEELEDYVFDKKYYKYIPFENSWDYETNIVRFKLVNSKGDFAYLHLYNSHNGYYYHGFEFKDEDEIIEDGYL